MFVPWLRRVLIVSVFASAIICQVRAADPDGEESGSGEINEIDYEIWDLMDQAVEYFGAGKTWYELFDVTETVPSQEIQKKYRRMSLQYHPDKNPGKEAEKKFQTLAGMAKILKEAKTRAQYDYWLSNGIPYWRGRGYYFRKSENLSILQTILVLFGGASVMQYAAQIVQYLQVRSGLALLNKHRDGNSSLRLSTGDDRSSSPLIGSRKGASRKQLRRSSSKEQFNNEGGLFDDANMKHAMDWLVYKHGIAPFVIVDSKEWKAMIKEDFDGDDSLFDARFPGPWGTMIFQTPIWLVKKIFGLNQFPKSDETASGNNGKSK